MPLPKEWASHEDFATLFQYFWHRDFPLDERAVAAVPADWTIHIGVVVRNIADLTGLVPRFEVRNRADAVQVRSRIDAVLRSWQGDEIALEWEWSGVLGNELEKLKKFQVWDLGQPSKTRLLKYAVLVTYTDTQKIQEVYDKATKKWGGARWPLLLVLIDFKGSKRFVMGKEFNDITMSVFDSNKWTRLRVAHAFPWKVEDSRWSAQTRE